jgi:hypothetical protein
LIFSIPLHIDLITYKIARLWTVKEMSILPYPHGCHINFRTWLPYLATIILNHPISLPLDLTMRIMTMTDHQRLQLLHPSLNDKTAQPQTHTRPRVSSIRSIIYWLQYVVHQQIITLSVLFYLSNAAMEHFVTITQFHSVVLLHTNTVT